MGDRIVLMKDGKIIQVGTGEDILTNPATRYVERFVEDVDVSKVLTARLVMRSARVVAYAGDGPHVALRKMKEEAINSLCVVKRDFTLIGQVRADEANEAIKRGEKKIEGIIENEQIIVNADDTLNSLYPALASTDMPVPVVDENHKLLGVVSRGSLLSALADGFGGEDQGENSAAA